MNPLKLGAMILILTAGLAGGYLIIKDSKPAGSGSYIILESSGKAVENSQKSPIQWVEKVRDFISNPTGSLEKFSGADSAAAEKIDSNNPSSNLTEFVAKSVSGQMQYLSQSGKDFDPNDSKNQEIIKKALASLQTPSLFNESINDKDLKISQNNSIEAKRFYLESMGKIVINSSNVFSINPIKALDKLIYGDASAINQVINYYTETYKNFLSIAVPSDWLDLHKRYLTVSKQMEIIYRGMADFQNDPVKAALLGDALPNMIEAETNMKKEYYNIEKEFEIK